MTDNIYLEVSKNNGAILSFYLKEPTTPSDKVDYIEVTGDELIFLNALEDEVLPTGMVATIDDLYTHRTRVQTAKKAKAAAPTGAASKGSQQPVSTANKAYPHTTNPDAKERFIASLKKHRSSK